MQKKKGKLNDGATARLRLNKSTLRRLADTDLADAKGGAQAGVTGNCWTTTWGVTCGICWTWAEW
jgi:hypothetical protein